MATIQIDARCTRLLTSVPAENPDAQEGRFQEEGQQGFDRQRRAEDVAHKARILRPVHAELEFLHDAGDDAHGEVDDEQLAPELGHALVHILPGAHIERFHEGDDDGQAQRQGHEEEMIDWW